MWASDVIEPALSPDGEIWHESPRISVWFIIHGRNARTFDLISQIRPDFEF